MDLGLKGLVVLVTGSSTGIGEGIAQVMSGEGATVIVHGRNPVRTQAVAQALRDAGRVAHHAIGSLESDDGAKSVYDQAIAAAGRIDILANNVGIYRALAWNEVQAAQWVETLNANVVSAVRLAHLVMPGMIARKFGRIIQIASNAAHIAFPHLADYAASKAAMVSMSVSLAQHLANTGVTANTVSPGPISTPSWDEWALEEGAKRGWGSDIEVVKQHLLKDFFQNPSGRFGHSHEIGKMVALIASPDMGYVNGANLRVDGGRVPTVN